LHTFSGFVLDSAQDSSGWSKANLVMVTNSYINVIIGLAVLYVNLAIYNFLYSVVAALVSFIPKLAIPIAIRNKSDK
jgi:hypothetical protein